MSPPDRSRFLSCEGEVREQIELLWRYQTLNELLDPHFIRRHALCVVQLSDELAEVRAGKEPRELQLV